MAPKTLPLLSVFIGINILLIAQHVSGEWGSHDDDGEETQNLDCPHPHPYPHPHPKPQPRPTPNPPKNKEGCPKNVLKLGVCSSILHNRANYSSGVAKTPCCKFFFGLYDFDAAFCLCTALKANIFGIHIDIPFAFSFLFNFCDIQHPQDFKCLPD